VTSRGKPAADIAVDARLIRALLEDQHPDLASLPLIEVGEGWDNRVFRLGDSLAVRVPRRVASVALLEREQRWLPELAARLPLRIPAPVRSGRPGDRFPWPWSIVPWFEGHSALTQSLQDLTAAANVLGGFLRALHQPAPGDAPRNPWRGVPLANRNELVHTHLHLLAGAVDDVAARPVWEQAMSAPAWPQSPVWIHGDLFPGNLVVSGGRISAVIDFGDLTAGDPATDFAIAWMLLPLSLRAAFLASASADARDPYLAVRARGWALAFGLVYLVNASGDEAMQRLGRTTIDAVLGS